MIFLNFIKGLLIGITMMIPGLSGGSCAMVLRIYDKLMFSISNIFNIKNILFLTILSLGIISGFFFFSKFFYQFTTYNYFKYIITVIIILNITFLLKEFNKFNFLYVILIVLGYISMLIIKNLSSFNIELSVLSYILIGLLLAISLILPGLGASYVLYILGLYDKLNNSIVNFDYTFLLSLGITTILGILISAKLINFILNKDKLIIYSLVIGLLIGGI